MIFVSFVINLLLRRFLCGLGGFFVFGCVFINQLFIGHRHFGLIRRPPFADVGRRVLVRRFVFGVEHLVVHGQKIRQLLPFGVDLLADVRDRFRAAAARAAC